ncbi:translation-associated GTPase [Thermogladius calderae 1633]|uniref:Translation-associated GTPase n=1 Tax=Thermogladius calderae (strain DSM 22663 / VKM B-2946 / 1633) TaxID=1184251 RepID=I3TDJ0_THEC1|nr:translation-associated GTPase [Thermogladius calderae 1633]
MGVGYIRIRCAHVELNLPSCNPRTGACIRGERFVPVKIMDVAGLIPGASQGRGLGNKFMDDLRQADVLIHVVDAAGSTDPEGRPVRPGSFDPVEEVKLIQAEIDEWFWGVVKKLWETKIQRSLHSTVDQVDLLARSLSGLSIRKQHIVEALREVDLESKNLKNWSLDDVRSFSLAVRRLSKPIVIAANKIDVPEASENVRRLVEVFGKESVVPVSSLAELLLRKLAADGVVEYLPGDPSFRVVDEKKLSGQYKRALELIEESVLRVYGSTGVQSLLNKAVFEVLRLIPVYPVEDANKYTDHHGNVLPDVYLVPWGTTAKELAYMIHTDLGEGFLYAINARTKERVGEDYQLKYGDVIKVVSAKSRR